MKANIKDALMHHLRGANSELLQAQGYITDRAHREIRDALRDHRNAIHALYQRIAALEVTPLEPCACTHSDHFITCKHHRWPAS